MEISEHREINVQDASSTVLLSALARLHAGIMQTVMPPEFIVGVYLMGSDVRAFEPFAFLVWLLPCRRIIPADRNHAVIC